MDQELFESKDEKRKVNETMASLLLPLKLHCDEETKNAISKTLRIIQTTEIESWVDRRI